MAEQNLEITYLPYGLDEISQLELLTALANDLPDFMNKYKWLLKPKNRDTFLKIYSDMVNGLTGASNDSGLWSINTSNDLNSYLMSPREKEIAEHAAYYIQLQMAKITPRKKEEENKDAEPFNFVKDFNKSLLNYYGGNPELFKDPEQGWDAQDARGANGLRGIDKRRGKMIEALKNYKDSLTGKNYNFEGTSFKDLNDAQTKIQAAIDALGTVDNTTDDLEAFNALGLPYRAYFSNGGNDASGYVDANGNSLTWEQYSKYLLQQSETKAKLAKQNAYNNTLFINRVTNPKMNGRNAQLLKEKYKDSNSLLNALQAYSQKDIRTLTPDEQSEVVGAYRRLANLPIDNKLLHQLQSSSSGLYKNAAPNRFRKIQGIDNLIWDSVAGQIIQINTRQQLLNILNLPLDLFAGTLTLLEILNKLLKNQLKLREQYAQRTEMTPQDWEYVASIVPDIASIPDEEPFSAAGLAFAGSIMRHHALANRPGGMSASDKWWLAADYLGAGLAAIPGFGDAYLVGRILNTTRKFATGLFAAAGAYGLGSATVNAFGKWAKGEDMTLQEKMDVVMAIPSLVSAYRLRSREGLNDAAKAANLNNVTTNKGKVKVTITDESGNKSVKEITGLSEQKSKELLKQFKNAGNDNSKKTQILKNDSEVQTKASEQGIDLNRVSIETDSRHMASYRKPTEIEFYSETSPSSARIRYNQEIENLKNSGHNWQVRRLLIYDKFYKGTGGAKKESEGNWFKKAWHYVTDTPSLELANRIKNGETPKTNSTETPKTTGKKTWSEIEKGPKKWSQSTEAKEYREMLKGNYSSNAILGGTHKIGDMTFDVEVPRPGATNGFVEVTFKNGNKETIRFDTQKQLLERISKIIKNNRVLTTTSGKTKVDAKEMGKILKSLKARGLLKHGGKVEPSLDTILEDFIKNNNI